MRRIAAAVLALALCASVGTWAIARGPDPALALTPTPSFTPTPTQVTSTHGFTNGEGTTDEVTVFFFMDYQFFQG